MLMLRGRIYGRMRRRSAVAPIGGNDANTVLLLHCDGAAGATAFPDSSATAKVATANGDAKVDTTSKKFGTGSLLLDGTGDYLSFVDSDDWHLFAGDCTIDCWVNFAALPGAGVQAMIFSQRLDGNNSQFLRILNTAGVYTFNLLVNNVSAITASMNATLTPVVGAWHHFAVERHGANCNFYHNGVKLVTTVVTAFGAVANIAGPASIGATPTAGSLITGRMDEIRVSKGIARYAGVAFTPPTQPYS